MLIAYLKNWLSLHVRGERGQDLIEYAMLGGLVAAAILGAVILFGGALTDMATGIANCIDFNKTSICGPF
jgi:hypothetical protein